MRWFVLFGALVLLLAPHGVQAQSDTLDENAFWDQMRQTETLLEQAISQPDPGATAAKIHLWDTVKHVRVQGAVIDVDLSWLTHALTSQDVTALREAQQQIHALLAFHDQQGAGGNGLLLSKLADVLKDPRFQYPDATMTPTPQPTSEPAEQPTADNNGGLSPEISQMLLAVGGVVVVAGILIYLARNLRIQRAELPLANLMDDPTTSSTAVEMASDRAATRDYRSAIRYLYLSSLLTLDERGLIHYDSALTNREHLRQIDDQPQLLALLRPIVSAFEDVWYGYAPVDEAFYERYRQNIQKLQQFIP